MIQNYHTWPYCAYSRLISSWEFVHYINLLFFFRLHSRKATSNCIHSHERSWSYGECQANVPWKSRGSHLASNTSVSTQSWPYDSSVEKPSGKNIQLRFPIEAAKHSTFSIGKCLILRHPHLILSYITISCWGKKVAWFPDLRTLPRSPLMVLTRRHELEWRSTRQAPSNAIWNWGCKFNYGNTDMIRNSL